MQYDSSNVLVEDVEADSQRQDGDDFAMGVHLDGTAHAVVLRRVVMRNSFNSSGTYWNGDGFVSERGNYDLRFENTTATGSTDGGYDLKSTSTVLVNPVASGNGRNYRLWAKDVKMSGCTGTDPVIRGGTANQNQVWIGTGAKVEMSDCKFSDSSAKTQVFELGTDATLVMNGGSLARSSQSTLAVKRSGSVLTLNGVQQSTMQ